MEKPNVEPLPMHSLHLRPLPVRAQVQCLRRELRLRQYVVTPVARSADLD